MIPEREIWQAAAIMIKRFGHDAAIQAAMRADELAEDGDLDGADMWKAIMQAVEELQRKKTTGRAH